jgi:Helix-turn-helix domain
MPGSPQSAVDLRLAKSRRTEQTSRARERFLDAYASTGNLSAAARLAGVNRTTVYQWEEHDETFAAAFREAGIQATEALEREAWRRAKDGIPEPVFQHGKLVGTIQRYSDQLLMFLLKARAPERYRDRVDVSVTPVIKAVAGFDPADVL